MTKTDLNNLFPWNDKSANCFFCGIGGVGMNPLAHLLALRGARVSGSDAVEKKALDDLRKNGVRCFVGHNTKNINGADVFVYSTAIKKDNPEFIRAKENKLTFIHRAELLAKLVNNYKGICIAGSHGKTTVSAMTSVLFEAAGLDPTAVVGGYIQKFNAYYKNGKSDWVVVETDESDGSFQLFNSEIAVILNIDTDHLDYYKNLDELIRCFGNFIKKIKPNGTLIFNADDPNTCLAVEKFAEGKKLISCSRRKNDADFFASDIYLSENSSEFIVTEKTTNIKYKIQLNTPGEHNVLNAVHAIAAARVAGATVEAVREGCSLFTGVNRRFQLIGKFRGADVIDDYAHHPAEIQAVLKTARNLGKKIITVFQPHRFTRTEKLFNEFVDALSNCENLILTDIYSAGEKKGSVTGKMLYDAVAKKNETALFIEKLEDVPRALLKKADEKTVILFLGAGTISNLAHKIVEEETL